MLYGMFQVPKTVKDLQVRNVKWVTPQT